MTDHPSVSVIVPVWNGEATIGAAVESLLAQDYPREALQIIVVDNGSSDRTKDIVAAFPQVLLLSREKSGSYAARNRGLEHATGKYVAFTDADCRADPAWIANAVRVLETDPSIGIVAGHIEVVSSGEGSRSVFLIERELSFKQHKSVQRGRCATANWVSPRTLIMEAGGFDENGKSGGDWLLSSQISASNYRIVYEPTAIVLHPSRSYLRDLLRKRRRVAGGAWSHRNVGLAKLLTAEGKGVLRKAFRVVQSPSLRPSQKALLLPVVILMSAISVGELIRLAAGGAPRRA